MNKLFIYYSLTNNGDKVADYYKDKGYDIRKIEVKKKLPKIFFFRIMTGGFKALINYKEKLINFDNNIDNYNEIIIGSPIWFDRLSTPVRTALNKLNLENKTIHFVLYSGSGTGKKAEEFINKNYSSAKITILKEPNKYNDELKKLD
ncbi:MAG: hypothetical protein IKN87_01315 [Bacilli bacterium]|nr:hypothetical protein [Bacilli bacterium]